MRQPMEERKVLVSRTRQSAEFPASFMLAAAMNPCPCGYYSHPTKTCNCPPGAVIRYLNRISGPLLDRIDLQVEVVPVPYEQVAADALGEIFGPDTGAGHGGAGAAAAGAMSGWAFIATRRWGTRPCGCGVKSMGWGKAVADDGG